MAVQWSAILAEIQAIIPAAHWQTGGVQDTAGRALIMFNRAQEELARKITIPMLKKTQGGLVTTTLNEWRYNYPSDFLRTSVDMYAVASNISSATATVVSLNDLTPGGFYHGTDETKYFKIVIDDDGSTPESFAWYTSTNGTSYTLESAGVDITASEQFLEDGVSITFGATTGHTNADQWIFTASLDDEDIIPRMTRMEMQTIDPNHNETTTSESGPDYINFAADHFYIQPKWAGDIRIFNYIRKPAALTTTTSTCEIISDGTSGDGLILDYLVATVCERIYRQWLHTNSDANDQEVQARRALKMLKQQFEGFEYPNVARGYFG